MLIHLDSSFLHSNPSFSSINIRQQSKLLSKLKKKRRYFNAVEKDSEFELDPDEAREALRNLDKQLQSLSAKRVNNPKIRATEVKQWRYEGNEENSEMSGSFWAYAVSFLLLFTIFYNIFFLTVIKPSVDGPIPFQSPDSIKS